MKFFLTLITIFLIVHCADGQHMKGALSSLDSVIARRDDIQREKTIRIEQLKRRLTGKNDDERRVLLKAIYNEYKSFIYDSAFRYARLLQHLAIKSGNPVAIAQSRIDLGFVLVSAGLFNETIDTLQSVSTAILPDSLKPDFYYLIGRTCYDLAEFSGDNFFSIRYTQRANQYLDSGLLYLHDDDPRYLMMKGLKNLHISNYDVAVPLYERLLKEHRLSYSQTAIIASTLSYMYSVNGNDQGTLQMLVLAATSDILSSTKETVAIRRLAELLYHKGNYQKAYQYIKIAMEDANFYGAKHRKIQVAAIFPIIEGKQLSTVEERKNLLVVYATGITLLTLVTIVFGVILYNQFKKLKAAKQLISDANEQLTETNHQLVDSNKIKEEYVTYYFNTTAEYISKLENLKKTMEMKLMTRKPDEIRFAIDTINIKKERDELYHNFDKVFLKLFPDFVPVFQSLFKEEDRVQLKDGQLLNTELRIFALIRMGITDTEKISKILDYSVATIYTYKTRIRSKSIVPNDEFDKRIMGIRTI